MTSIATISNADSNYIKVFRISPVTHQRIQFYDLMPTKKVGILKSVKSLNIAVFFGILVQLEIFSCT